MTRNLVLLVHCHYYFTSDRYRAIGRDFSIACAHSSDSRPWVLLMHDFPPTPQMADALLRRHLLRTATQLDSRALLLYERTN